MALIFTDGEINMSKYVFFEATDEIFQGFDNYEIWPCVLLNPTDPAEYDRSDFVSHF
jgi:hypothetical protein